jgi:hypothetical protein
MMLMKDEAEADDDRMISMVLAKKKDRHWLAVAMLLDSDYCMHWLERIARLLVNGCTCTKVWNYMTFYGFLDKRPRGPTLN